MSDDSVTHPAPAVIPRATHGSPDHPLVIGDIQIPCYVLEDGTRVLAMTGLVKSLDMSMGGDKSRGGKDRLARFAATKGIIPFVSNDLLSRIYEPLKFRTPTGALANGYEATVLTDLCDVILEARRAGTLIQKQQHVAERAELLVRGFARIGIIALVDEATGYQESRDRDALHKLLAKYLTAERLAWAKRFPDEYWKELFRLRGLRWPAAGNKTPRYIGHLVNRTVYDRLPPGVLEELQRRNPPAEGSRRRRYCHHQFLSEDFGQADLRNHLLQIIPLMRIAPDWETFEQYFALAFPAPATPLEALEGVAYRQIEPPAVLSP